jgi:hypothetical protein
MNTYVIILTVLRAYQFEKVFIVQAASYEEALAKIRNDGDWGMQDLTDTIAIRTHLVDKQID